MMQWKKSGYTVGSISDAPIGDEEQVSPSSILNHLVAAVATSLARVGVTSLSMVFAVASALLVAAVLFGVTATDAVAMGQWCPRC